MKPVFRAAPEESPSRLFRVALLLGLSLSVTGFVFAATLEGEVVAISDGDTIKVLDVYRVQHIIRLAGIDAPEKKMPFGQKSKQNLSDLVYGKHVVVEGDKLDRYGRLVGKILVDGSDANLLQIQAGLAWHYKQYQREQSVGDRQIYSAAEDQARMARRGLWAEPDPVPPWDWRVAQKVLR